ncbi:hypothetical protein EX895_000720 [Sporisorium graminicola]|uniref:Uncharacterized protein n=1 Tax=Sporisorium graminicola TaxID=280036 RepID=A0A4U7L5E7_9BASI|nr:hypothetical protein EX895_000720 [Sporisorium graminicola]TKY90722.1 hypothetical protein EX895_000720 [Sporisorium graminicola]
MRLTLTIVAAILFSTSNAASLVGAAASSSAPFSPSSDPGIFPGDSDNPLDGWRSLPEIAGARIDNSTLIVGQGSATLLHYIDADYDPKKIKRAVIQIHGENRDSWNQWIYSDLSAKRAATGGSFNRDEVVVMAPMFFNTRDQGAYPYDSNLDLANSGATSTQDTAATPTARRRSWAYATDAASASGFERRANVVERGHFRIPLQKVSTTEVMIWKSVEWGDGSPAYEPVNAAGAGSFDALDAAVNFFLDKSRFPHLRNVVVAGFSLGAQLTNRYATFRNETSQDNRIIFWISSPNAFVYLDDSRPAKIGASCAKTYTYYKYGLNGTLPQYYLQSSQQLSPSQLISRYLSRTVYYLVGMKDTGAGLDSCSPNAQGSGHLDKMYYWTQQVVPLLPGSTGKEGKLPPNNLVRFVDDTGHQDWKVITSDPGVETLWLKKWYANGTDANAPQSNGVVAAKTPSAKSIRKNENAAVRGSADKAAVYGTVTAALVASLAGSLL